MKRGGAYEDSGCRGYAERLCDRCVGHEGSGGDRAQGEEPYSAGNDRGLYYYRSESPSLEMDFFVRDAQSLIPVEVKAKDNATVSLNRLISSDKEKYDDIQYGIKLCNKNIGFNGKFYTFPYFLTFLLRRFLKR